MLVDDDKQLRDNIRMIVEHQPGWTVCSEACNGLQAVEMAQELEPDVVLMDINMPVLGGAEATAKISSMLPDTKIIALSVNTDSSTVRSMINAGALGYITKLSAYEDLTAAVNTVLSGKRFLSPIVRVNFTDEQDK
jgi:two-component system invasion response regulator UvrY